MNKTLVLYYREGCHLCDEMELLLEEFIDEQPIAIERVDIDRNPQLKDKYNADVPVVMYKNKLLFRHFFDESRFREAFGSGEQIDNG